MLGDDKKLLKDIAEAASTLGRTLEHLQKIRLSFYSSHPEGFVTAFHATLQQAVGSTKLMYYDERYCRYINPQLILSKRYGLLHSAGHR